MAAEKLRDLSHPLDVSLLDATVAAFYGTGSKEEVSSSSFPFFFFYAPARFSTLFFLYPFNYVSLCILFLGILMPIRNNCTTYLFFKICGMHMIPLEFTHVHNLGWILVSEWSQASSVSDSLEFDRHWMQFITSDTDIVFNSRKVEYDL
ncbi:UNVERIFIED_CONTAM: protein EXPORTIN 1B [Sesamum angustifolium]|uniref:Protein EXPORTIN 1B n=1 Tax=Sesamum angustifolium TaxID=2727405 RepID=A0AAW2LI16_9LAMI